MLNNFIYAKTKDLFIEQLEAHQILDEAIVFIEDTKEIWNHGTYFAGISDSGLDQETIDQINAEIENVRNSIPITTSQLTNDSGFITSADVTGLAGFHSYRGTLTSSNTNINLNASDTKVLIIYTWYGTKQYVFSTNETFTINPETPQACTIRFISDYSAKIIRVVTPDTADQYNIKVYADFEDAGIGRDKQDTLVSGTNIKTINGQSLLGEGDITISTDVDLTDYALKDDIPTTTSQLTNDSGFLTEHQDISGKQDVLVTGVNIKTINGYSLLGEGTIDIPAEENVQSDWDTSSTSEDSYIKNRPMYANWTNIPDGHLTFSGEWEQLPGTYAGERVAFKYISGSSEKYCTVGPNNEEYMLNPGPSVWVKMDSSVLFIKCSYAHDCKISYSTKLIPLNDIYIPTTIARTTSLDLKQDVINDLDDIREKANSALQNVPDEYITETELNTAINSVAFTEDYGSEVVMPVSNIVSMSQEEYDALVEKNPNTIYLIV